jgi:hypothetical protein
MYRPEAARRISCSTPQPEKLAKFIRVKEEILDRFQPGAAAIPKWKHLSNANYIGRELKNSANPEKGSISERSAFPVF